VSDALDRRARQLSPSLLRRIDPRCDRFESDWRAGHRPRLEEGVLGLQRAFQFTKRAFTQGENVPTADTGPDGIPAVRAGDRSNKPT
jgi:hypothetical protein